MRRHVVELGVANKRIRKGQWWLGAALTALCCQSRGNNRHGGKPDEISQDGLVMLNGRINSTQQKSHRTEVRLGWFVVVAE
jgi:hypothetical protein